MNVTNVASSYIVRTDSIKSFLSDIIKVKILSPKEEIEIFQEIEKSKNKVYNYYNTPFDSCQHEIPANARFFLLFAVKFFSTASNHLHLL